MSADTLNLVFSTVGWLIAGGATIFAVGAGAALGYRWFSSIQNKSKGMVAFFIYALVCATLLAALFNAMGSIII